MSQFIFNTPSNTYEQTVTGGTVATNELQPEVVRFVKALEPRKTPLLEQIMSNDEVEQEVHKWGQSVRRKLTTRLSAGINNSTTTIPVTTGEGKIAQKWMTAMIYDVLTGTTDQPDYATGEKIWVSADVTGDSWTVGTRGSWGTSAFSHLSGALVFLTGTAEPQNAEHSEASRNRGVQLYNYPQRFAAKLTADKRAQNQPTYESPTNILLADFAEEILNQKIFLEQSCWFGTRHAGDGTQTNPSMMGGINQFLTTNAINLGGQLLTPALLDSVLRDIRENTDSGGDLKIFAGFDEAAILDTQINPLRRAAVGDTEYTNYIRKYNFRGGTYMLEEMRGVPRGNIYLLDTKRIKVRPFKGLNWHKSGRKGEQYAVDNDIVAISGDFTLEVLGEASMARIYNFNTDLNQYPQFDLY